MALDLSETGQQAVEGWARYVLSETGQLPATHPTDERMAEALAGIVLPDWLIDGVRLWLDAVRDRLFLAVDTPGHSLSA